MKLLVLLLLVVSCGDNKGKNTCISRDSKILECRAVESARHFYNSPEMLEWQKQKCEAEFSVNKWCYD